MLEILWLGLFALPVIAAMMWVESNILRGEWLKDEPKEPVDKVEFSEEAHELLEEMLKQDQE